MKKKRFENTEMDKDVMLLNDFHIVKISENYLRNSFPWCQPHNYVDQSVSQTKLNQRTMAIQLRKCNYLISED
jgi:hypothetical protein